MLIGNIFSKQNSLWCYKNIEELNHEFLSAFWWNSLVFPKRFWTLKSKFVLHGIRIAPINTNKVKFKRRKKNCFLFFWIAGEIPTPGKKIKRRFPSYKTNCFQGKNTQIHCSTICLLNYCLQKKRNTDVKLIITFSPCKTGGGLLAHNLLLPFQQSWKEILYSMWHLVRFLKFESKIQNVGETLKKSSKAILMN